VNCEFVSSDADVILNMSLGERFCVLDALQTHRRAEEMPSEDAHSAAGRRARMIRKTWGGLWLCTRLASHESKPRIVAAALHGSRVVHAAPVAWNTAERCCRTGTNATGTRHGNTSRNLGRRANLQRL
jgi:hypothetical protein